MENEGLLKIMQRMVELQEEILEQLKKPYVQSLPKHKPAPEEQFLDNADLKSLLKISASTLYRIKKNKQISSIIIGKRSYYSLAEFERAMAENESEG